MNLERMQSLYDQIEKYGSINMNNFQAPCNLGDDIVAKSIEEFRSCGNYACIDGHLALNKMFLMAGGQIAYDGSSVIIDDFTGEEFSEEESFSYYMDLPIDLCSLLIQGRVYVPEDQFFEVSGWDYWKTGDALAALSTIMDNFCHTHYEGDVDVALAEELLSGVYKR